MRLPLAFAIARGLVWDRNGTDAGAKKVWRRIAYATRYGNAGLTEALELDQMALQDYLEAVSEIVQEENQASRS